MTFNANLGEQSFTEKQIIDITMHPAIVLAMPVKANQGELEAGQIVAKDTNGKIVPYNNFSESIGTGNGTATAFSGTVTNVPLLPGSVVVTDGTQVLYDDGCGRLYGDGSGTVNYKTGEISATFNAAPATDAAVSVNYANQIVGVLLDKIDTTKETVGRVVVHGVVIKSALLVAGAAATQTDVERLSNIYAI